MLRYCLPVSRSRPSNASHCDLVPIEAHLFDPLARLRRLRTAVRETCSCLFIHESRRYQSYNASPGSRGNLSSGISIEIWIICLGLLVNPQLVQLVQTCQTALRLLSGVDTLMPFTASPSCRKSNVSCYQNPFCIPGQSTITSRSGRSQLNDAFTISKD